MIAGLTGRVVSKSPSQVILDVQGVGYEVHIALSTYFSLPDSDHVVTLNISTQLRNDTIQLYGFLTTQEKEAFLLLTGITGIGPKIALSTLSTLNLSDLRSAIQSNDIEVLSSIPGIGRKTAGRMVLELKDKIGRLPGDQPPPSHLPQSTGAEALEEDAISALLNLGYRTADVKKVVRKHLDGLTDDPNLETLIRHALKDLAKA